jgi:hypothetical protein
MTLVIGRPTTANAPQEHPMKYLALIYASETADMAATPGERRAMNDAYVAYEGWLKGQPGKRLAGEALLPSKTAKTIRVRDGKTTVTDGPFAETKEHLGGFYLYDAKDLAEALELAGRIPGARRGCVEVRQVMVFDTMG